MVMKKEIREMQRRIHVLKEERKELSHAAIIEAVDDKIFHYETELTKMEREYNGESIVTESSEVKVQFADDYPLTVLNKSKDSLNEKLSEIDAGAFSRFSDEGVGKLKKSLLSDLADIEMAIDLLQEYAPYQEDDGQ